MAQRFAGVEDFYAAIGVCEKAMEIAASEEDINKIKCNLAYYCAETNNKDYEAKARQYSAESYAAKPERPNRKDTVGYVRITFGNTKEEVLEGMELCFEAYKVDLKAGKAYYEKHSKKAMERLATFGTIIHPHA